MADPDEEVVHSPSNVGRGIRIRRIRLLGVVKNFDVDFTDGVDYKPLAIIAGRINTGKTSVLRFLDYLFGADGYPAHTEITKQVRSALVEIETPDGLFTLERLLGAKDVLAYPGSLDRLDPVEATRLPLAPPADPGSLSQWLLTTVGLQDVQLKEAPTQSESGTDRMSFRDLMWTVLFLNERVGTTQLLHSGNWMKELKLQQVVDAIFDVHDNEQADLARRVRDAQNALDASRHALALLEEFVSQQENGSIDALEAEIERLDADLRRVSGELRDVTEEERSASNFVANLRNAYEAAAAESALARARFRDRRSVVDRFGTLRAQYADDLRKLTLLVEAEQVFDQLSVVTCPACLKSLPPLTIQDGECGLCHQPLGNDATDQSGRELAKIELQSAKRRFKDLDEYWQRLAVALPALQDAVDLGAQDELAAAGAIDEATHDAVSPYLAQRDQLQRERQALLVLRNSAEKGLKLLTGLEARRSEVDRVTRSLETLREQQRSTRDRPDRAVVIGQLSRRFGDILREIEYPKISEAGELPPYIDDKLVPYVRGLHFKEASSGGQVLVSIAWMLAIFELAIESGASHPGVLMVDTFQKNLGGKADDEQFADIHIVERLYAHITTWLSGAGAGAQVIIVDNTPPDSVSDAVVVRYTRNPNEPPFGLIDNEMGYLGTDGDE